MKKRIYVTKKNIEDGQAVRLRCPNRCSTCPVTLALRKHWPKATSALSVWYKRSGGKKYPLPEIASRFIIRADLGERLEPFSFTVEV